MFGLQMPVRNPLSQLGPISGTNCLPKGFPRAKLQVIDSSAMASEICGAPKPHVFGAAAKSLLLRVLSG